MTSPYRKGKKPNLPPFVPILRAMLKSTAWQNLTNASRVAYLHIKAKCVSFNPGELTLSFAEMEKIMDRHTFSAALKQLEATGFIIKTQSGGLYRRRNYFRLSDEWKNQRSSGQIHTVTSGQIHTVGEGR